jgi:hypothetical protein
MTEFKKPKFNIIRYRGTPNKATTLLGFDVERVESIFVHGHPYNRFIPCAPYSDHFIYEVPPKYRGTSAWMCTCGSYASIVGVSAYEQDASPSGLMLVCYLHATFGKHNNGGARWV